jgi:protein gp37
MCVTICPCVLLDRSKAFHFGAAPVPWRINMGKTTKIQWCDGTVNPSMGCDGCELWDDNRKSCYAGIDTGRKGGKHPGFPKNFAEPQTFPGRMAEAAAWSDLRGQRREDRPWLDGHPRLIFVSDMGDSLSKVIEFDYLKTEIIDVALSEKGRRHIWLWLTKRPGRMAEFSGWLLQRGISWPTNVWPGTSVTRRDGMKGRLNSLLGVGGDDTTRFVSVEPQIEELNLLQWLPQLDWIIQGGESGSETGDEMQRPRRFDVAWARSLAAQCKEARTAYFLKQLGTLAMNGDRALNLKDHHGGDWDQWPKDLRIRQVPDGKKRAVIAPVAMKDDAGSTTTTGSATAAPKRHPVRAPGRLPVGEIGTADPKQLDEHWLSRRLFSLGSEDENGELVASIAARQYKPILITGDGCASPPNTVLDGRRQRRAAIQAGVNEVMVERVTNLSVDQEEELIIHSNIASGMARRYSERTKAELEHHLQLRVGRRQGQRSDLATGGATSLGAQGSPCPAPTSLGSQGSPIPADPKATSLGTQGSPIPAGPGETSLGSQGSPVPPGGTTSSDAQGSPAPDGGIQDPGPAAPSGPLRGEWPQAVAAELQRHDPENDTTPNAIRERDLIFFSVVSSELLKDAVDQGKVPRTEAAAMVREALKMPGVRKALGSGASEDQLAEDPAIRAAKNQLFAAVEKRVGKKDASRKAPSAKTKEKSADGILVETTRDFTDDRGAVLKIAVDACDIDNFMGRRVRVEVKNAKVVLTDLGETAIVDSKYDARAGTTRTSWIADVSAVTEYLPVDVLDAVRVGDREVLEPVRCGTCDGTRFWRAGGCAKCKPQPTGVPWSHWVHDYRYPRERVRISTAGAQVDVTMWERGQDWMASSGFDSNPLVVVGDGPTGAINIGSRNPPDSRSALRARVYDAVLRSSGYILGKGPGGYEDGVWYRPDGSEYLRTWRAKSKGAASGAGG